MRWEQGLERDCPRCDAGPGEPCRNQYGIERATTHQERKKDTGSGS